MPRVDFKLWDRVYILKLICTAQMTYSSFITLVYFYLIILQSWTTWEGERVDIMRFKWSVIVISVLEFGLGTLLSFAANMRGIRRRRQIIVWSVLETFLVPTSICLLMQLYYRILNSKRQFITDPHYARVNIAQVCFLLCQYIFIGYALDFLTHAERKPKAYDPSIRPESVYAPTDPQITTTESRHIRMSQSFLFQPSSSKKAQMSELNDGASSTTSSEIKLQSEDGKEWKRDGQEGYKTRSEKEDWTKDEDTAGSSNTKYGPKIASLRSTEKIEEDEWEREEVQEWAGNLEKEGDEKNKEDKANKHT